MDLFQAIILGIVEGFTEFLPISSTAHLILLSDIFKIQQTDFHKFFEVFIQSGAILAVLLIYFKSIKHNKDLIKKVFASFLPTAFLGFILYKIIKNIFFESHFLIIVSLILVGFIFIITEKLINKNYLNLQYNLENLTYKNALLIGIFQSLAVIPGISRAGAVILGMLFLKFKRSEAVFYSFLIALPTIFSASLFDLYKIGISGFNFNASNLIYLATGFFTSLVFAFISIKWLINYLQKNNLAIFGWYRIIMGTFLLIYFLT